MHVQPLSYADNYYLICLTTACRKSSLHVCCLQAAGSSTESDMNPPASPPVGPRASSSAALPPAAHQHAPSEAYELEDLDEDWLALLNALDTRLLEVCCWIPTFNILHGHHTRPWPR